MVMQAEAASARYDAPAHLRSACGRSIPLHVPRWFDEPGPHEQAVLDQAIPTALDIGCGPGRHTLALTARGVNAVGVDAASESVRTARQRGARVLHRSVFDRLPGEGRWGSALLLDGNVGIGGDPPALLRRIHHLLHPGGRLLIELEAPGVSSRTLKVRPTASEAVWLPWPTGSRFPWATLGVDDLEGVATSTGFATQRVWESGERWFARMDVA